jgi:hypothetical protein
VVVNVVSVNVTLTIITASANLLHSVVRKNAIRNVSNCAVFPSVNHTYTRTHIYISN